MSLHACDVAEFVEILNSFKAFIQRETFESTVVKASGTYRTDGDIQRMAVQ